MSIDLVSLSDALSEIASLDWSGNLLYLRMASGMPEVETVMRRAPILMPKSEFRAFIASIVAS